MKESQKIRLLKAVNEYYASEYGDGRELQDIPEDGIIDLAYTEYECADGQEHGVQVSFSVESCSWLTFMHGERVLKEREEGGIEGFIETMEHADFDGIVEGCQELVYERYGDPADKVLLMETHRSGYAPDQCGDTMTVGELIEKLREYDEGMRVYFSNDGGYTYGQIGDGDFRLGRLHQ